MNQSLPGCWYNSGNTWKTVNQFSSEYQISVRPIFSEHLVICLSGGICWTTELAYPKKHKLSRTFLESRLGHLGNFENKEQLFYPSELVEDQLH